MKERLYRGKRTDNGEWVEGGFVFDPFLKIAYIVQVLETAEKIPVLDCIQVDPETVGQYTVMTDKNGKKIYEGDILAHFINYLGKRFNGVVRFDFKVACWVCDFYNDENKESAFLADWLYGNKAEIIGNIHDNPELLEVRP